jgi:hypothetical protein
MWSEVHDDLLADFRADPAVQDRIEAIERAVGSGTLAPADGARRLLDAGQSGHHDSGGRSSGRTP